MSKELYELLALGARYVFAGLMVLIVLRAWRITLIDARRAGALRRLSPQTGLSGELLVLEGDGKARRGMRYPVIREGMIGASRRSDIRVRHSSVRRKHAYFQLTPEGMTVTARPGAVLRDGAGRQTGTLTLSDGDEFTLGRVRLLLVLTEATGPSGPTRRGDAGDYADRDYGDARDYDDARDYGDAPDYHDVPDYDGAAGYDDVPDYDGVLPPFDGAPDDTDDLFLDQPVLRRRGKY